MLAHHISLINVQAGVALHLHRRRARAGARGARRHQATRARRRCARCARPLGVLRADGRRRPARPTPALAGLDELVERPRPPGSRRHSSVTGEPRPLPPGVDRAAYRIVQEALTNVRPPRAARRTATVRVDYGDDVLRCADRRRRPRRAGREPDGSGSGIVGHARAGRRRSAARLDAGPRPTGGFRVAARRLPDRGGADR